MSRLIIVSNRVAPISEGEPAAGGLAIGVYDALKETGGMWFGWSGEVVASGAPQIRVEEHGPLDDLAVRREEPRDLRRPQRQVAVTVGDWLGEEDVGM